MIEIQVSSHGGIVEGAPLSACFDEFGGTIGRAPDNTLVLLDPERRISRVHAQIDFRGGRFLIRDLGTAMPIVMNGQSLGQGKEAELADGDALQIGAYTLRVSERRATEREPRPAAGAPDPFAPPVAAPGIPHDYDPFSDRHAPGEPPEFPASPAAAAQTFDLGPGTREKSLDEMFGLGPALEPQRRLLEDPLPQPAADGEDPLAALIGIPAASPTHDTRPDHTPERHGVFHLPKARGEASDAAPADAAPAEPGAAAASAPAAAEPSGMILSWEEKDRDFINTVTINSADVGVAADEDVPVAADVFPSAGDDVPRTAAPATDPRQPARDEPRPAGRTDAVPPHREAPPPRQDAAAEALLQAFFDGLGAPQLASEARLTPEMLQRSGALLRELLQGTLDLLLARATFKREIRADQTMIVQTQNNPLKFSPNVDVALLYLFGAPMPGFMEALPAVRDAFDDLRAHQLGFVIGMRAALDGVLRRFDPHELEGRLSQRSMLDSLLPMNRRAKLWDVFIERYGDISKEAADDFHALFGREFVRAYEEQIARFAQGDREG